MESKQRFPAATKAPTKRALAVAAGAVALLIAAGTAHAALQDRDLDGDTVVDAFYDTDLDITWLRNADVNGMMNWDTAVAWADGFSFAGYADWRLPTSDTCIGSNCAGSEMGHLWHVELGNVAPGPMTSKGGFENLLDNANYWSGTVYPWDSRLAFDFHSYSGYQGVHARSLASSHAMAVRDGDVAVVPEPQTLLLMLAGLTALAVVRRQRSR